MVSRSRVIRFDHKGQSYVYNRDTGDISDSNFMALRRVEQKNLHGIVNQRLVSTEEDLSKEDLVREITTARNVSNSTRARDLLVIAMSRYPAEPVFANLNLAELRRHGQRNEAISFYEDYKARGGRDSAPVLTVLAAIYHDLGNEEMATRTCKHALGASRGRPSPELFNVHRSIQVRWGWK